MLKWLILITACISTSVIAQSSKPMSKSDFEKRLINKYNRYDLNRDGKITPKEMLKVRPARENGAPYTIEEVTRSVVKKDGNGDGVVTIAEAVASELPRFDQMDANKDGIVTDEERASAPK